MTFLENAMNQEIMAIVTEVLRVTPDKVVPSLSIGDIPEWSSMAQMEIISTLESRLDIEIPLDDLFDLTSVQAIVDEVEKLKAVQ